MRMTSSYRLLLPLVVVAAPLAAQNVKTVTLSGAKEFPESFAEIGQVAELKDGRVVLTDNQETKLQLVDFAKGTMTAISRTGAGPLEFKMPGALHASSGDTLVFFDIMQRRLLVLGPAGNPVRTAPYGDPADPMVMAKMMMPTGMDGAGRLWGQTTGMNIADLQQGKMTFADTVEIQWYDRKTNKATTLAKIASSAKQVAPKMEMSEGAFRMTLTAPDFRPTDLWAVLPDGRVALFTGGVYRAKFLAAGKPAVLGPVIPATPVPVTAAEKKAVVDSLQALMDKQMEQSKKLAGAAGSQMKFDAKVLTPANWAAVKPPVGAVLASPDGRLWVMTATPASVKTPRFDVLNGTGALIGKVVIPAGERLVGFGRGTVYTVRKDEDDLQYVRRYTLPALP